MNLPQITQGNWMYGELSDCVMTPKGREVFGAPDDPQPEHAANMLAASAIPELLAALEECRAFIAAALDCLSGDSVDFITNNAEKVEGVAEAALLQAGCTE